MGTVFGGHGLAARQARDSMDTISQIAETLLGLAAQPEEITFMQIALRAALVYGALIAFVRMGKKRTLGQATPFDAIIIILIGLLVFLQ